ncbi:unnamed protein product [Leptidea sinapis]|uniref:Uncharacterized protein n=1 Tax=Leptidea sinapis TaxID=189913 RepID=A0A5E4R5C8_9NEOP|nr:unnamed protein product [Leptidea sinapis]
MNQTSYQETKQVAQRAQVGRGDSRTENSRAPPRAASDTRSGAGDASGRGVRGLRSSLRKAGFTRALVVSQAV